MREEMLTKNSIHNPRLGIRLMLQAAIAFSIMGIFVKLLGHRVPSLQIVFYRSLIGLILTIFYARHQSISIVGKHHFLLILRGFSGFIALIFFFYAIVNLPLGTAILLNYTAPFFVILFSFIWMREKVSFSKISIILMSFCGVFLLMQGDNLEWNRASFSAVASAFFAGLSYTTIRSIKEKESHLTIIFYFTLISTILSGVVCLNHFILLDMKDLCLLLCTGVVAFYAQIWLTQAYRYAKASVVSPFSYLTPMLAYCYGLIFWQEKISILGGMGIALILLGGFLLTQSTKYVNQQK